MVFLRIKTLVIKEMQTILRDVKTRIIIIVPPLLQLFIFSFASTMEIRNISLGILNRDTGPEASRLTESFRNSPYFTSLTFLETEAQAETFMDTQQGVGVLHFPPDFSQRLQNGEKSSVLLTLDGRKSNVAQIVSGYVTEIIASRVLFRNAITGGATASSSSSSSSSDSLQKEFLDYQPFVITRNWYNPNLEYMWFTLPCLIGILCMVMGITIPALSVAREREFGTFDQLLVSPLSTTEILIGKTVPSLLIGLVQATGMFLATVLCFRIPFIGSLLMLYLSIAVFICSVTGVGLFISSLSKTQQQAILGVFVFTVPAVMISGYATPVENMPEWLQWISLADPLRYFLVLIKGIFLKNMTWNVAFENLLPLAGLTVVFLLFAGWFFKRKLD